MIVTYFIFRQLFCCAAALYLNIRCHNSPKTDDIHNTNRAIGRHMVQPKLSFGATCGFFSVAFLKLRISWQGVSQNMLPFFQSH